MSSTGTTTTVARTSRTSVKEERARVEFERLLDLFLNSPDLTNATRRKMLKRMEDLIELLPTSLIDPPLPVCDTRATFEDPTWTAKDQEAADSVCYFE